jgi:hypothetical protein
MPCLAEDAISILGELWYTFRADLTSLFDEDLDEVLSHEKELSMRVMVRGLMLL